MKTTQRWFFACGLLLRKEANSRFLPNDERVFRLED